MTTGEKLVYLKRQHMITTKELSVRSGVPVGTLNKILRGETQRVSLACMAKIAGVFQVPVESLIEGAPLSKEQTKEEKGQHGEWYPSGEEKAVLDALRRCPPDIQKGIARMIGSIAKFYRVSSVYKGTLLLPCLTVSPENGEIGFFEILAAEEGWALQADFAVRLWDTSLLPLYHQGRVLAVKQGGIRTGALGVYLYKGELLIRRYRKREGICYLSGLNRGVSPKKIRAGEKLERLGEVLGEIKEIRRLK